MSKNSTMYKLVDQYMRSYNGMEWEIGKWNEATGKGVMMCSDQVLHCYATPEQAVLFNPIHGNYEDPLLLEIECSEIVATDGLKFACKKQRPIKIVKLPVITTTQKVAISIKIALLVCKLPFFVEWAGKWLSGEDRSCRAAKSAAARSAAWSAARSAAESAAARSAARSAAKSAARSAAKSAARSAAESAAAWGDTFQEITEWVIDNIE